MSSILTRVLDPVIDILLPPKCLVCGGKILLGKQPRHEKLVCHTCLPTSKTEFPNLECGLRQKEKTNFSGCNIWCKVCGEISTPAFFKDETEADCDICAYCFLHEPSYRQLRSMWRYTEKTEACIKAFKYAGKFALAKYFVRELNIWTSEFKPFHTQNWNLILPLPSSPNSIQTRGYGHMALVSRKFGRALGVEVSSSALWAKTNYKPQASQALADRWQNVRHRFSANPEKIRGRDVLVLDDICTTSASLEAASRTLLKAGAASVDVVTISRSRSFQSKRILAEIS